MITLVSKSLSSCALFISLFAVYPTVFMLADDFRNNEDACLIANVICAVYFAACWTVTWQSSVVWTTIRKYLTGIAFIGSTVPSVIIFMSLRGQQFSGSIAMFLAGLAWLASWIASTALSWRETAAERVSRLASRGGGAVPCPDCGYDLTGLQEARCPECGNRFTLDELLISVLSGASTIDDQQMTR